MRLYYSKSFDTKKGKYVYDALMNSLHEVDEQFYKIINSDRIDEKDNEYYNYFIEKYNIRSILNPPEIKIAHRYNTKNIRNIINSHRKLLILSITNRCNLNCTYCIYHDKFSEDSNINHTMSFETAKKAIDNLIEHSINLDNIHIGFYGGESLLEFELIKKCVEYVNNKTIGITTSFGITTNGILLSDEKTRRYFERYNFQVTISLDGPKYINDRYRISKNGKGSYNYIINNVKIWYKENPKYVTEKLFINSVAAPPVHRKVLDDFFMGLPMYYSLSDLAPTSFFNENIAYDKNEYIDKVLSRKEIIYSENYYEEMLKSYKNYVPSNGMISSPVIIPGGTCLPVYMRWYVNSKGEYYPCERVPETEEFCIGNVDTDVDYEKVVGLFDKYIETAKSKCNGCWGIGLCGKCFKNIEEDCEEALKTIEKKYIYYIEEIKDNKKAIRILDSISYSI